MQYLADGMFNNTTRRSLQWKYRNARLRAQKQEAVHQGTPTAPARTIKQQLLKYRGPAI